MFEEYLVRWQLSPEGDPIVTSRSRLLPVRWKDTSAMLKVATVPEERLGGLLMAWWDGQGAAKVLARDGDAILLERAENTISLAELARKGRDDDATRIICATVAELHVPRTKPLPELTPLRRWFRELEPAAAAHGGLLSLAALTARELLEHPRDVRALHGDIHHGNILDFGARGWLAIDPKGLLGERGFDYANLFCNPDLADPTHPVATAPGRFQRRLEVVSEAAGLERRRLVQWVLAWSGLSAAWLISEGERPVTDLQIADLAAAELDR
ncbi:MAG: aminoglycoside phosphotransferase family protein [Acidobacteriota bacterium]